MCPMKTTSPTPRRIVPLAKRPVAGRPAVRRYIIVPAARTPVAGVRAP